MDVCIGHRAEPTQEELLAAFDDIGHTIRWKISKSGVAKGKETVSSRDGRGYLKVHFNGRQFNVHRLLWIMRNGPIPEGMQIDHRDGDQLNNSPDNHRLSSHTQNMWNRRDNSNNTSGVKGVCWNKKSNKWQAAITIKGKSKYLGLFDRIDDAARAVEAARRALHGEFVNNGSQQSLHTVPLPIDRGLQQ